mmetsp:Transcript_471/g.555  ORF Transcript_471/g.555 Transcript_471/m.555 type:complete len:225 (+) Transcript_471:180-854(+)
MVFEEIPVIWDFFKTRYFPKFIYPGVELAVLYGGVAIFVLFSLVLIPKPCQRKPKPWRRYFVQVDALAGTAVSAYAFYIEISLEQNPFYTPACNTFGGSCSKVLTSSHAHMLSHLNILPKGHIADLSLAQVGLLLYAAYFLAISIPFGWYKREELFLLVAVAGAAFSCYLLFVIKFVLLDFCIVCTSFHICNFIMLFLAFLEYRNPTVRPFKFNRRSNNKTKIN